MGGSGAEAGGGDACLEVRTIQKGCIVDDEGAEDGCGSRVLGVSILRLSSDSAQA